MIKELKDVSACEVLQSATASFLLARVGRYRNLSFAPSISCEVQIDLSISSTNDHKFCEYHTKGMSMIVSYLHNLCNRSRFDAAQCEDCSSKDSTGSVTDHQISANKRSCVIRLAFGGRCGEALCAFPKSRKLALDSANS